MKNIEDLVSPFIQSHFPSFYQEEGGLFIEFVKQYYKWLESTNNYFIFLGIFSNIKILIRQLIRL